jgi:hypothetical protein
VARLHEYGFVLDHEADVVVRFWVEAQTVVRYAVMLRIRVGDRPQTVRLFDNAHGDAAPHGGHHMHRYSSTGEREDPTIFHHGTAQEAMKAAIDMIRSDYEAMISLWR